eukprot:5327314-Prymnesium_polylepis.2
MDGSISSSAHSPRFNLPRFRDARVLGCGCCGKPRSTKVSSRFSTGMGWGRVHRTKIKPTDENSFPKRLHPLSTHRLG